MNELLLVVGAVIFIGFLIGVYRGAIRIAVSLATTIVTLFLVTFATPFVAGAVNKVLPVEEWVQRQVTSTMSNAAAGIMSGEGEVSGMTEENVRRVLEAAGVTEEQLAQYGISIGDIVSGQVTGDQLAQYGISSSLLDGLTHSDTAAQAIEDAEIPRDVQVAAIEAADLPDLFKSLLTSNNNSEIYEELGVETFAQYVGSFLAKLIVNIVSFLGTFILATIVIRAIVFALDVVSQLPGIGFLNRLGGGVIGVACALVVVWVCFIIITLLYVTGPGKEVYEMIKTDSILTLLYDYNPIMKLATRF